MAGYRRLVSVVVECWELVQVELHGRLSVDRIHTMRSFLAQTTAGKAMTVCVLLPLPFVILLTAMEAIPLAPLNAGTLPNYAFWVRYTLALAVLTPGLLSTFQSFLPEMNITSRASIGLSVLAAIASAGFAFTISLMIGFPVPFTLIASSPAWFSAVIPVVLWVYGSRFLHDKALLRKFIRCWLMLVWFVVSIVLYTVYVYGFQHFDSVGQIFYVGLLPILKMTSRNVFSYLIGDRFDAKAEIIIFNVEVFGALNAAVAVQNASKLTTTLAIVAVDIAQSIVAFRDIDKMLRNVHWICSPQGVQYSVSTYLAFHSLADIATVVASSQQLSPVQNNTSDDAMKPKLEPKSSFATQNANRPLQMATMHVYPSSSQIYPNVGDAEENLEQQNSDIAATRNVFNMTGSRKRLLTVSDLKKSPLGALSTRDLERVSVKTAQVLFTAEFVLLVKYVEAMVPAIYAVFVAIAYNLPNREYSSLLCSISSSHLSNTILSIMLYCLVKTLTFCIMCFVISRKLGVSAIHLVAFMLMHHWDTASSKILTWLIYLTVSTLGHAGSDFSFKFTWLGEKPSE